MGTTEFSRLGDERYYYIFDRDFAEHEKDYVQDFCEDLKDRLNRYRRHKPILNRIDVEGMDILNDYYGAITVAYFDFMILDKPLKNDYYGEYESLYFIVIMMMFWKVIMSIIHYTEQ